MFIEDRDAGRDAFTQATHCSWCLTVARRLSAANTPKPFVEWACPKTLFSSDGPRRRVVVAGGDAPYLSRSGRTVSSARSITADTWSLSARRSRQGFSILALSCALHRGDLPGQHPCTGVPAA